MMKSVLIVVSVLLLSFFMREQAAVAQKRPLWLGTSFSDKKGCNSYFYCETVEGHYKGEMREEAVKKIIENRYHVTGLNVNILSDGSIVILNSDLTVKARCLDEYIEWTDFNELKMSVLVQVVDHPDKSFDPVRVSEDYPFSPRVFIPGMEQIYKGSTAKGVLFIVGEIASGIGIAVFENNRSYWKSECNRTHDVALRRKYLNEADKMQSWRNGFIAGAAAIYLWNVIDGCVARGGRRLWVKKCDLKATPVVMKQGAGVAFVLNF